MKTLPKLSEYVYKTGNSELHESYESDLAEIYDYTTFIKQPITEKLIKDVFKKPIFDWVIDVWISDKKTIEDLIPYNLEITDAITEKYNL